MAQKFQALNAESRHDFFSRAPGLGEDAFLVIDFEGSEALSRPYAFDIQLASENPDIDLGAVLRHPALLRLRLAAQDSLFHGVLENIEEEQQIEGLTLYRARLRPRVSQLALYRVNEVYVGRTVPELIELVLKDGGLTGLDYELALTATYGPHEQVTQYQETHLDFISRLMEREGIYYFFSQGEDRERLIITDRSTRHERLAGAFSYSPDSSLEPLGNEQLLRAFVCRQKALPKQVIVMDYNYRRPSLEIRGEAPVDPEGRGEVYLYGEHTKDQGEAKAIAGIRAQEIRAGEKIFLGESVVPVLKPGYLFELRGHFRASFNRGYLLTELTHEGSQAAQLANLAAPGQMARPFYRNHLSAIPDDVQFRPQRITPRPHIGGTMNAIVDAEGTGNLAELDEQGRYKVWLPLDRRNKADAKASRWIRMMQPFGGTDHGMHFPLHKGAEVLLTFIDGDPDRPIIAGTVPNPDHPSLVTGDNPDQSVLRFSRHQVTNVGVPKDVFHSVGAAATDGPAGNPPSSGSPAAGGDSGGSSGGAPAGAGSANADGPADAMSTTTGNSYGWSGADGPTDAGKSIFASANKGSAGNSHSVTEANAFSTTAGISYSYVGSKKKAYQLVGYQSALASVDDITGWQHGTMEFLKFISGPHRTATEIDPPGSSVSVVEGNSRSTVQGDSISVAEGDTDSTVRGNTFSKYVGNTVSLYMGNTTATYLGGQESFFLGAQTTTNIGLVFNFALSMVTNIAPGLTVTFELTKQGFHLQKDNVTVEDFTAKVSEINTSVSKVATGVSSVSTAVDKVSAQVTGIKTSVTEIKSSVTALTDKVTSIETTITALKTRANDIQMVGGVKLVL